MFVVQRLAAKKAVYEHFSENRLAENKGRLSGHPSHRHGGKGSPIGSLSRDVRAVVPLVSAPAAATFPRKSTLY
jgi:hypothetical protein